MEKWFRNPGFAKAHDQSRWWSQSLSLVRKRSSSTGMSSKI